MYSSVAQDNIFSGRSNKLTLLSFTIFHLLIAVGIDFRIRESFIKYNERRGTFRK